MIQPTAETGARTGSAPRSTPLERQGVAVAIAAAIAVALGATAFALYGHGEGAKLSLSIVFGALFGFILQRSRFCFFCMFRDWLDNRDPRGLLGLLLALGVGMAGYALIYGAWLPDSSSGRLPPGAFIGPVSAVLVAAGLAFGAGMAISGSCVSAHLNRLGEGSPTAPFALIGTAIGMALGFLTWNALYTSIVVAAPAVWLPGTLGYTGTLIAGFAVLAVLAAALLRWKNPRLPEPPKSDSVSYSIFVARWPAWVGGLAIAGLATVSYLRVAPLGVTAELGARSRQAAAALGILPSRLEGLDTLRGCVIAVGDALLTPNGLFVIALVLASFAAALAAGQFKPSPVRISHVVKGLSGGALLGWGAMTGLGCTVGTLLSGIMAGALSGWVFGAAVFAGIAVALRGSEIFRTATT